MARLGLGGLIRLLTRIDDWVNTKINNLHHVTTDTDQTISGTKTFTSTIEGSVTGNAGTATTLQTTRKINGTDFDGSANITTASWGTSRNVSIADSSTTNTGTATLVNGGSNIVLNLPATIKATLTGNADTATQFNADTTVALTGDATGTSAGSKKGWSVPVTLTNSGVTAGTYGPSADVTGDDNTTISVPEITVDAKGRVTSVVNRTYTSKNNTYNVYDKTLTIQKNGTNVATFTSNSNSDVTANITVPTSVSELTNDSGYLTSASSLDSSKLTGTIDIARLPKGALERLVTVADQTARFALTTNDVQLGDTVKQLDTGTMYIVSDESKLSSADGYTEYTAGAATSVPWSGVTGKPSSYTPASHSHTASDVSGLATVATSGSYNDLSNKPTIPTVNDATLTIQKNGTTVKTFTANASSNVTANITVPTKTSELTNDSHQTITTGTDTTSTASPAHSETFTCIDSVTRDSNGHVTAVNVKTVTLPAGNDTDTLVAQNYSTTNDTYPLLISSIAGISSTSNRGNNTSIVNNGIYANPSTGSIYATKVYSGGSEVLTSHQSLTDYVKFTDCTSDLMTAVWGKVLRIDASSGLTEIGKCIDFHAIDNDTIDYAVRLEAVNASSPANGNGSLKISATGGILPSTNNAVPLGNTSLRWSGVYTQALYSYGDIVLQGNYNLRNSADNGYTRVQGGSAEGNGGRLVLSGKTRSVNAGCCELIATDGTNTHTLAIRPNGTASITGTLTAVGFTGPLTGDVTGNCSGSSGSCTGNAATATQFSANKSVTLTGDVTGTASSKAGWSVATTLANSGVTAGTYGPSADVSGSNGATITVPQITVDAKGRVTSVTNRTYTSVDTNTNTDTLVTQNVSTTNATYPILLCATADATANQGAKTAIFAKSVKINPSTNVISASGFTGPLTGNVTGNCSGSSGSCTGNAATATTAGNVTGTVAIANGGTGATTRLNAVKALTSEDVGTSTQYFLTITQNWGKAGYCSTANAKTVLDVNELSASEVEALCAAVLT